MSTSKQVYVRNSCIKDPKPWRHIELKITLHRNFQRQNIEYSYAEDCKHNFARNSEYLNQVIYIYIYIYIYNIYIYTSI